MGKIDKLNHSISRKSGQQDKQNKETSVSRVSKFLIIPSNKCWRYLFQVGNEDKVFNLFSSRLWKIRPSIAGRFIYSISINLMNTNFLNKFRSNQSFTSFTKREYLSGDFSQIWFKCITKKCILDWNAVNQFIWIVSCLMTEGAQSLLSSYFWWER